MIYKKNKRKQYKRMLQNFKMPLAFLFFSFLFFFFLFGVCVEEIQSPNTLKSLSLSPVLQPHHPHS